MPFSADGASLVGEVRWAAGAISPALIPLVRAGQLSYRQWCLDIRFWKSIATVLCKTTAFPEPDTLGGTRSLHYPLLLFEETDLPYPEPCLTKCHLCNPGIPSKELSLCLVASGEALFGEEAPGSRNCKKPAVESKCGKTCLYHIAGTEPFNSLPREKRLENTSGRSCILNKKFSTLKCLLD